MGAKFGMIDNIFDKVKGHMVLVLMAVASKHQPTCNEQKTKTKKQHGIKTKKWKE